jgi:hypothetical protein
VKERDLSCEKEERGQICGWGETWERMCERGISRERGRKIEIFRGEREECRVCVSERERESERETLNAISLSNMRFKRKRKNSIVLVGPNRYHIPSTHLFVKVQGLGVEVGHIAASNIDGEAAGFAPALGEAASHGEAGEDTAVHVGRGSPL